MQTGATHRLIMNTYQWTALIALLLSALTFGMFVEREAPPQPASDVASAFRLPEPLPLPPFQLSDDSGEVFDRGRLQEHWSLVFFGFTHCPDICPTTLATLAQLRGEIAPIEPAIQAVFVSVDPARDNASVLHSYVKYFDPDLIGVTGEPAAIAALADAAYIRYQLEAKDVDGDYSVSHSAAILLLDPEARIVARFPPPHRVAEITATLQQLLAANAFDGPG